MNTRFVLHWKIAIWFSLFADEKKKSSLKHNFLKVPSNSFEELACKEFFDLMYTLKILQ